MSQVASCPGEHTLLHIKTLALTTGLVMELVVHDKFAVLEEKSLSVIPSLHYLHCLECYKVLASGRVKKHIDKLVPNM
jgi:hypothetical protein